MNRALPSIPGITIADELGHGAYSIVYRATYRGVPCALKLPRTTGGWTHWVFREAVALARVKHRGLPSVLEVGVAEERPYLVMELVSGETLADRLQRAPISTTETIAMAIELADALRAVHAAGLVHRDVKPRNIVVEGNGRVRLVDFGFAAPVARVQASEGVGTPGYSAPEQLRHGDAVDGRADLYALGRVISECASSSVVTVNDPQLRSLADVVRHLLAVDPDRRYPDAIALLEDLRLVEAGHEPNGPFAYPRDTWRAPIIGREREIERIARVWRDVSPNAGALVVLRGARGSGKTRLLAAASAVLEGSATGRLLHARCREGDAPLSALRQILECTLAPTPLTGARSPALRDALRASATEHLAAVAMLIAPRLEEVLGAPPALPPTATETFREGAAEILVRLSRALGRLALFVDDFQWIDPVSRDVLGRVSHRLGEAPALVVLGTRLDDAPSIDLATSLARGRAQTIELEPFDRSRIAQLVASHLGEATADPALVQRIEALADGTPLGVLDVLDAFLDVGVVLPHAGAWRFDAAVAERAALPAGARALIGHRVAVLPPATRRVLATGAVLGATFEDAILAAVVGLSTDDIEPALADGLRAGVIEREGRSSHRFVHDSLRERLDSELDDVNRRRLHQRAAEVYQDRGDRTVDALCTIARHFAAGEVSKAPRRSFDASRAAASAVLERFDNEMALAFLGHARVAAESGGLDLDATYHKSLGEAHLRLGMLVPSERAFEAALGVSRDDADRAAIYGRLAWVRQLDGDPDGARNALERAFGALRIHAPSGSPRSTAHSVGHFARGALLRRASGRTQPSSANVELLCELHYHNARLGSEYGQPLRLVESALETRTLTQALPPSRAKARAEALYGIVLTALGRRAKGAEILREAAAMATAIDDPTTHAFCIQLEGMASGIAGDTDRMLAVSRECIERYGHWLELSEVFSHAGNGDLIESLRGRPREAWTWIDSTLQRVRRSTAHAPSFFLHRARATLASTGAQPTDDPWLARELRSIEDERGVKGFYHLVSWGPRARWFLERADVGTEFDELVRAFEREGHNPRSSHPMVGEYFVAVTHGRLHQCLRASGVERARRLGELRRAANDLRAAAKIPLLKAHSLLADGNVAWLEGRLGQAHRMFAEAEAVADQTSCTWVLYGIARARAHMLRAKGRDDAAHDQARVAETLARSHGAEPRAKLIREELGLPTPVVTISRSTSARSSGSSGSRRARRQLASLLHVVRAPQSDARPQDHARSLLDGLLRDVDADRGFLVFSRDGRAPTQIVVGRTRAGAPADPDAWRETVLAAVRDQGAAWPAFDGEPALFDIPTHDVDASRILAVPLFINDVPVGATLFERTSAQSPFSIEDRELLNLLSGQVPITLEIARLVAEREQLHQSLQQVQKMEAVGQLAAGVAHDFNNMMSMVTLSIHTLREHGGLSEDAAVDVGHINEAAQRATDLARRLLAFSRHQPGTPTLVDVNMGVEELAPLLQRTIGRDLVVETRLDAKTKHVYVDRAALDSAVVNLAVNARDAMQNMPTHGRIILETSDVELDEEAVRKGAPRLGAYVCIAVRDTGRGIPPENMTKIFDPFFSTKGGTNTGLGLTMVYAFAKNSGGCVFVESEVSVGTTFRLYLPCADSLRVSGPPATSVLAQRFRSPPPARPPAIVQAPTPKPPPPASRNSETAILLVDDDDGVRESIRRILKHAGYKVFTAASGLEAMKVAATIPSQISLVILDVMMPGMTGPELAQRLLDMDLRAKILFVSGYAPDNLPVEIGAVTDEMLLQKPFAPADLLARVDKLVAHAT